MFWYSASFHPALFKNSPTDHVFFLLLVLLRAYIWWKLFHQCKLVTRWFTQLRRRFILLLFYSDTNILWHSDFSATNFKRFENCVNHKQCLFSLLDATLLRARIASVAMRSHIALVSCVRLSGVTLFYGCVSYEIFHSFRSVPWLHGK